MKTEPAIFFGSGPVAAASLEELVDHTPIELVVTKPRPPHHRGTTPVLDVAERLHLPILTVSSKHELDEKLRNLSIESRYAVLIDFGIIISRTTIDFFPLGIINSHFSLLPQLRGADPITWTIANGDQKTGVSLMLVDEGMDTGPLLTQKSLHLTSDETAPSLTEKLINLSDDLLRTYVPRYLSGQIRPRSQPHPDRATYSRKLTKQDGVIDFTQPAQLIEQKIRAFLEWPQSRAQFGSVTAIVTRAHVSETETELSVLCGDKKYLAIDNLKPLGKKEMSVQAFLAGYRHKI